MKDFQSLIMLNL